MLVGYSMSSGVYCVGVLVRVGWLLYELRRVGVLVRVGWLLYELRCLGVLSYVLVGYSMSSGV